MPEERYLRDVLTRRFRLPRLLVALLTGAMLTTGGVIFQAVLRNPLADPFILGVSSGAALGKALALLFTGGAISLAAGAGDWQWGFASLEYLGAIGGALLSIFLVYISAFLARRYWDGASVLLAGIVVNSFLGSGIIAFLHFIDPMRFVGFKSWLAGVIPVTGLPEILALCLWSLAWIVFFHFRRLELDKISVGDRFAFSQGLDPDKLRRRYLFLTSIALAPIIALTGIIGFVGLILPHALRGLGIRRHGRLLWLGAVTGGAYLLAGDYLLRLIQPREQILTIGAFTALVGGPAFLWILSRERGRRRA